MTMVVCRPPRGGGVMTPMASPAGINACVTVDQVADLLVDPRRGWSSHPRRTCPSCRAAAMAAHYPVTTNRTRRFCRLGPGRLESAGDLSRCRPAGHVVETGVIPVIDGASLPVLYSAAPVMAPGRAAYRRQIHREEHCGHGASRADLGRCPTVPGEDIPAPSWNTSRRAVDVACSVYNTRSSPGQRTDRHEAPVTSQFHHVVVVVRHYIYPVRR